MINYMPFERLSAPSIDELNAIFSQYQITERILVGHISASYIAKKNDVLYHAKVFPRRFIENKIFVSKFHEVAHIMTRVSSPHFIPLVDYGVEAGMPYLVSAWVSIN